MILDLMMCLLLVAILVMIHQMGKMINFYGHTIKESIPTISLTIGAIISYISDKLRRFFRFFKRIFRRRDNTTLELEALHHEFLKQESQYLLGL